MIPQRVYHPIQPYLVRMVYTLGYRIHIPHPHRHLEADLPSVAHSNVVVTLRIER